MSFYSTPTVYSSLLGEDNIPATMLPSGASKMIPCTSQLKTVRTQSANLTAGSLALFQLQTGMGTGYLKSNSLYFTGSIRVTGSVSIVGPGSWRFVGPTQGTPVAGDGEGDNKATHAASAMISRLTVANGASQISQQTNYSTYVDLLRTHATSSDYNVNDATVYEYNGVTRILTANQAISDAEGTINFAIPLCSPVFCSPQSVPLFLLNSPLSIEILFNSLSECLVAGANTTLTGFSINNAQIVYEEIVVSPELKQSVMSKLQGGALFKMFLDNVYSIQSSAENSNSYNIGIGANSVKGVIGIDRAVPGALGLRGQGDFTLNGFSNVRVLYDGKLINNFDIGTDAVAFSELNRCLHSMHDSNITSCLAKAAVSAVGATACNDYVISKFAWGCSSQCVNDYSVSFSGVTVQTITIQHFNNTVASGAGGNSVNFQYVNEAFVAGRQRVYFIFYDELLTIDGNGVCALVR
jgi:hypothetical protein